MSHLSNPLATAEQLHQRALVNSLPAEIQDSIRYYTARLTQAAGILLRLPQDITAQANILLYRYWLVDELMQHEFSDLSAATIYMTAKVSASPRSLRSITNVYAYLLSPSSTISVSNNTTSNPESYYVSESTYVINRNRYLHIEGQLLNALGFNVHVALPHPLAITYLQALDVFSASHSKKNPNRGKEVGRRAIEYLNTALLSPQMLYLTHQPCSLATAAIYLAARDIGIKLPDVEWWEVFDCEREELGFLAVGMRSVDGLARKEQERWGVTGGMISRSDVRRELGKIGNRMGNGRSGFGEAQDEEAEMARLMDEKVGTD
ncbi:hypothetical protein OIDMADRAFT_151590 [Oidiodendron maius Zn]|uniref:Cyclin-like domain-containing protein n=1 Tax=Oidiodendron maius (strain Zn) TaxID=913774 RepID=A0A0C3E0D0_OIDMZ|nr:hypothetical protein OIDMADRAFT_151590 [Oidiodendron maius Zn]